MTLALGIGATTSIFTLVHAVLLKSLPVADPAQLVRVGNEENCCINGGMQDNWSLFSFAQYKQFKEHTPGFEELAAMQAGNSLMGVRRTGNNKPAESYRGEFVSGNYFSTFGIPAYKGRMLSPQDDTKGAPHGRRDELPHLAGKIWRRPLRCGQWIRDESQPVTVVGIAPPGFFGDRVQSNPPSFWLPLTSSRQIEPATAVLNV